MYTIISNNIAVQDSTYINKHEAGISRMIQSQKSPTKYNSNTKFKKHSGANQISKNQFGSTARKGTIKLFVSVLCALPLMSTAVNMDGNARVKSEPLDDRQTKKRRTESSVSSLRVNDLPSSADPAAHHPPPPASSSPADVGSSAASSSSSSSSLSAPAPVKSESDAPAPFKSELHNFISEHDVKGIQQFIEDRRLAHIKPSGQFNIGDDVWVQTDGRGRHGLVEMFFDENLNPLLQINWNDSLKLDPELHDRYKGSISKSYKPQDIASRLQLSSSDELVHFCRIKFNHNDFQDMARDEWHLIHGFDFEGLRQEINVSDEQGRTPLARVVVDENIKRPDRLNIVHALVVAGADFEGEIMSEHDKQAEIKKFPDSLMQPDTIDADRYNVGMKVQYKGNQVGTIVNLLNSKRDILKDGRGVDLKSDHGKRALKRHVEDAQKFLNNMTPQQREGFLPWFRSERNKHENDQKYHPVYTSVDWCEMKLATLRYKVSYYKIHIDNSQEGVDSKEFVDAEVGEIKAISPLRKKEHVQRIVDSSTRKLGYVDSHGNFCPADRAIGWRYLGRSVKQMVVDYRQHKAKSVEDGHYCNQVMVLFYQYALLHHPRYLLKSAAGLGRAMNSVQAFARDQAQLEALQLSCKMPEFKYEL